MNLFTTWFYAHLLLLGIFLVIDCFTDWALCKSDCVKSGVHQLDWLHIVLGSSSARAGPGADFF